MRILWIRLNGDEGSIIVRILWIHKYIAARNSVPSYFFRLGTAFRVTFLMRYGQERITSALGQGICFEGVE